MSQQENHPLIAVILVNWNSHVDTISCIESLGRSSHRNLAIIVVDNGSNEVSVQQLKSQKQDFKLILLPENTGFTGGNNVGISYAQSLNADYIFILNNDTLVEQNCIARLLSTAESDPTLGVVTPKILFYPETNLIWSAGTSFNWRILMGLNLGYKKKDSNIYDAPLKLEYAVGCALLVKNSALKDAGMFTEDYFATWEDVDFGLRVRACGYQIAYEPTAIVWHKESSSAGGTNNPQYVYYQTRSAIIFKSRWSQSVAIFAMSQVHYFIYCNVRIMRLAFSRNFRAILGIFLAYKDALFGKLGKREYSQLQVKPRSIRHTE